MDHIKVSEQQNMCPFDLFIYIFASKIKFQMPKIQNDTNFVNRYRERVHCLATKGHNIPSHDHLNWHTILLELYFFFVYFIDSLFSLYVFQFIKLIIMFVYRPR